MQSRYIRLRGSVYRPVPITYTDRQRNKILSFFPPKNKDLAFEETRAHISSLIGALISKPASQNIKSKDIIEEISNLRQQLIDLKSTLNALFPHSHTLTIIRTAFYRNMDQVHAEASLSHLQTSALFTISACDRALGTITGKVSKKYFSHLSLDLDILWSDLIKKKYINKKGVIQNQFRKLTKHLDMKMDKKYLRKRKKIFYSIKEFQNTPGEEHPHYSRTIRHLANVWKKYTSENPTRHYSNSKTGGPFINYLKACIEPAQRVIKERSPKPLFTNKKSHVSIENIARKIIREKNFMAITPSK